MHSQVGRRDFLVQISFLKLFSLQRNRRQTVAVLSFYSSDGLSLVVTTSGTRAAPGTKIVSWMVWWGDGFTTNGSGPPPNFVEHLYDNEGNYKVRLDIIDSKGATASSELPVIVRGPIPIPTSSSLYGPQSSITCPIGAVPIPVGSTTASRQTLINTNPGATFCLASGTHFATGSNAPTSNQKFYGQFGAIIDGTTWARPEADLDAAPFKAVNNGVTGVEIYNLVISNCPSYAINAYLSASNWKVQYCEITGCRTGISVGSNSQIRNNYIHSNIGTTGDPNPALRGGGFSISQTDNVIMDTNEIASNGTEQKFIGSSSGTDNINFTITNNYVHHNIGNGLWSDGYGSGGVINTNRCEFNGQNGIVIEKGKSITVDSNIVSNNIQSGILNTESRDCTITNNTLDGNSIALDLFVDLDDVGTSAWGIDLLDNIWQNNTVTVPNNPSVNFATVLSHVGAGDFTPYTSNAKNNDFDFNTYNVHSSTGNWWNFGSNINWTSWQALPQDPNGIRNVI